MSNQQPDRLKPGPRRAEPLQPDRPSRGIDDAHGDDLAVEKEGDTARKQKEQTDTALENTREGYGS